MKAPQLSYRVVQRVINAKTLECQYSIVNEDNEPLRVFGEYQDEEAYATWWSWLTAEEQAEWIDYEETLEAIAEEDRFQQWERRSHACDR